MHDDELFENSDGQDDGFFGAEEEQTQTPSEGQDDGFFGAEEQKDEKSAPPPSDPAFYEKLSYGKAVFRRVERWRRKAKRRGIEVPYLDYELHKPEKPRILFWILAIISAIIFVGIIGGIIGFYIMIMPVIMDISDVGEAFRAFFKPEILAVSLGASVLPAFLIILVYIMFGLLMLLPILLACYFYNVVFETFYLAKCSKEEFARGNIISGRIKNYCIALIATTIIFIVLVVYVKVPAGRAVLGVVYAGLMLMIGGLLALILLERKKCNQWFETLDMKQKQSFLAHDSGIRKIKRRKKQERDAWNTMFP